MALSVTHAFVSAIPDDPDAASSGEVLPQAHWNAAHALSGVLPVANGGTGITSFGTGVDTFLGTPTSANLATAVTDETGTGALVFANTPTFVTPILGTPTSGNLANCTGYPVGSISGTVPATAGGTGITSYAVGDIVYADTATTLAKLADVATGNALISGGIGTAPSWGKIALATAVSGNLPVTNLNSGTNADNTHFWRGDGTWAVPASGGTPGGSTLQLQYNNASAFGGMSGTSWDDTNRSLTMTGATVTTSNPVLNMTQTWNAAGVAFSGLKLNVTNTASAAGSTLIDLQVATVNAFRVNAGAAAVGVPGIQIGSGSATNTGWVLGYYNSSGLAGIWGTDVTPSQSNWTFGTGSGTTYINATSFIDCRISNQLAARVSVITAGQYYFGLGNGAIDVFLTRSAAATLQHGAADAATAVAQTIQVQSVVAGTANGTAGADWIWKASSGTGTGAGGNIICKTPFSAKSSGTGQGTWVDRGIFVSKGKVLTSATPVSLFEIALPALAMAGGTIYSTIICTNGTDMQSFSQSVSYSVVNKAGAYTKSITATTGDKSVTGASTLTTTWSLLDGTNKSTVQLSATTSLTPSTNSFICYYSMWNNSEQATTIL